MSERRELYYWQEIIVRLSGTFVLFLYSLFYVQSKAVGIDAVSSHSNLILMLVAYFFFLARICVGLAIHGRLKFKACMLLGLVGGAILPVANLLSRLVGFLSGGQLILQDFIDAVLLSIVMGLTIGLLLWGRAFCFPTIGEGEKSTPDR